MGSYLRTNENLETIVAGLAVKPDDYIVAIGGSGDQAFALLEYVKRVLAVDISQRQITHMKKQVACLEEKDYVTFFKRRGDRKYFDTGRLGNIREKLSGLEIRKADIFDVCMNERGFNKVYLSNALSGHPDELRPCLSIISQSIPIEGLVYASNGININGALDGTGLAIDKHLAHLIFFLEDRNWDPIILRKLNEPTTSNEIFSHGKYW